MFDEHPLIRRIFNSTQRLTLKEVRQSVDTHLIERGVSKGKMFVSRLGDTEDKVWTVLQVFVVIGGCITLPILMKVYHASAISSIDKIPTPLCLGVGGTIGGVAFSEIVLQLIKGGRQWKRVSRAQLNEMLLDFEKRLESPWSGISVEDRLKIKRGLNQFDMHYDEVE